MTPARAREAQRLTEKELGDPEYMLGYVEAMHETIADLLLDSKRAVARERAAWKAAVKQLKNEDQHKGHTDPWCIGYMQALDDLLQRRGNRGGKT